MIDARDLPTFCSLLRSHFDRGAEMTEMIAEAQLLADASVSDANQALALEAAELRRGGGGSNAKLQTLLAELVRQVRGDAPDPSTNGHAEVKKSMPTDRDCPGLAGHVKLMLSTDNYWSLDMVEEQLFGWTKTPPDKYRHEVNLLAGSDDADTRVRIARFVARSNGVPFDLHSRKQMKVEPIPAFVPFPLDVLPQPISGAIAAHAAAIGCDPCMVALPMFAALAAAIGNSRRVRLRSKWCEPAIVWSVIVADSGQLKSPGLEAALEHLRKMQGASIKDHEAASRTYEADLVRYQATLADWRHSKKRAADPPSPPLEPKARRLTVSDATVEAIAHLLRDAPRGLLLARDELSGWLQSFDAYRGGRGGDVAHWLEWFHGRESLVDRKSGPPSERTMRIPRASLSICGTIQPRILAKALGPDHFADGLAARLLLAMPPRAPRRWRDATVIEEVDLALEGLFQRLLELEMVNGAPVDLELSPDALRAFITFFNAHGAEMDALTGDLAACWSKLEAYCARFALVLHLTRVAGGDREAGEGEEIAEQDVMAAVRLVQWFAAEATRVYAVLSEAPAESELRDLVDLIRRRGGRITARDLRKNCRRYSSSPAAEAALYELVRAGLGEWLDVPSGKQGGRPTRVFRLLDPEPDTDVDETPDDSSTPAGDAGTAT